MVKTVSRPAARPDDFVARRHPTEAIWQTLARVPDPEIPVISIVDLGIVRAVEWHDEKPIITVTPTYSGCPATEAIMADIGRALTAAGFAKHRVEIRLAPAWTTDWISVDARARLAEFGIAPPGAASIATARVIDATALYRRVASAPVACPRCGSARTRELSRFGSTPCKAQYRCDDCLEPFDYFKPH
jgi:ring-1,2-phenylacetyl-CoA epoxidase subunit PaaD